MHVPRFDRELGALLAELPSTPELNREVLNQIRSYSWTPVEPLLTDRAIGQRDFDIDRHDGTSLPVSVLSPTGPDRPLLAPCVYWTHGGGMVMGDRLPQIDIPLEWLDLFGALVVSANYRLAPEPTSTSLVDGCCHGLLWVAEHADELGDDPGPDHRRGHQRGRWPHRGDHPDGARSRRAVARRPSADLSLARPPQ